MTMAILMVMAWQCVTIRAYVHYIAGHWPYLTTLTTYRWPTYWHCYIDLTLFIIDIVTHYHCRWLTHCSDCWLPVTPFGIIPLLLVLLLTVFIIVGIYCYCWYIDIFTLLMVIIIPSDTIVVGDLDTQYLPVIVMKYCYYWLTPLLFYSIDIVIVIVIYIDDYWWWHYYCCCYSIYCWYCVLLLIPIDYYYWWHYCWHYSQWPSIPIVVIGIRYYGI